ncbi:MAG TPA: lipopolysaccharide biosynthesis protein [Polyangiales bacterium]|nr:lipopolysaccharide biosynthesis protein [Polyangiales bacterium]
MSLKKIVAKALLWTSLESFALSGLSLISLVVFARFLSPTDFGTSALALAIVQMLTLPVDVLFHDALIQRKDLQEAHVNSAFTFTVVTALAFTALCWFSSGLVERWMQAPGLGDVLRWMCLSLPGSGFGAVLAAMQRRKLEFRALALRSLGGRATSTVIAIGMALRGYGVWSLVAQQVLLVCLGTLTLWFLSSERPRFGFSWPATKTLLAFGWLSMLHGLFNHLIPRMYMLLVGRFLGTENAGLLSFAFRGLDMFRDLLAGALFQVAMPMFSRLQDRKDELFDAFTNSLRLTTMVAYPIFVGLAVCASETLVVVFGPTWLKAAPFFVVIALLTLPFFLRMYSGQLMYALGRPAAAIPEHVAQVLVVLVGMLVIGKDSLWLALGVWGSRLLLSVPIDMYVLRRVSGMTYARQLTGPLVPFIAAAGMACVVLLVKAWLLAPLEPLMRLVPMALIGAATYAAILLMIDRERVRQFVSFVGHSIRPRGTTD